MSRPEFGPSCVIEGLGVVALPDPTHDRCPGGSNTPGLIGGWTCPCDCHRDVTAPARTPSS